MPGSVSPTMPIDANRLTGAAALPAPPTATGPVLVTGAVPTLLPRLPPALLPCAKIVPVCRI